MTEERTDERLEEFAHRTSDPKAAFIFEQGAILRAAKAAFQRRVGMSETRMQVLGLLRRHGEISQAELQRKLDVDPAAVTRLVKQLEAEGLLVRRVLPEDNRFTLVSLTSEGNERLRQVAAMAREFVATILEGVSEEDLACVQRVTARLRANIEQL